MLETSNLARKYTHIYVVSENMPFSTDAVFNFADASIFLQKNQLFLAKIVPLPKAIVSELC